MATKTQLTKRGRVSRARPIYILVVLSLILVVCMQGLSRDLSIRLLGFQTYLISYTGSMEPELNYNDLIVVRRCDFEDIKKQDIVTFLARTNSGKEIVITHEVWDIQELDGVRILVTKGIAKSEPDLIPVTEDGSGETNKYIGKYVFKSAFIGHVVGYLKSTNGLVVLGINLSALILIYYILTPTPRDPNPRLTK